MALLQIRKYPDPVLRAEAQPVTVIDDKLRQLAKDMIETMIDANGVGLAAPQVGVSLRMAVVDFDVENHDPHVLINPVITKREGKRESVDEGCLSFPGVRSPVKRNPRVTCSALDLDGKVQEYSVDGLTARCIQHETDHLDGMLFIDKVGPSDKMSLRGELAELEDEYNGTVN